VGRLGRRKDLKDLGLDWSMILSCVLKYRMRSYLYLCTVRFAVYLINTPTNAHI